MPKARFQITLQFDTKLSRKKFDELALEIGMATGDVGECVYIATELVTTTVLRNQIDGFDVGTG